MAFIDRLPLPTLVYDYREKFVALDRAGRRAAFIALSPGTHPHSVPERPTPATRSA